MEKSTLPLKNFAANSFYAAVSEASTVFLFLLFIIAARFLGDEQFGVFSFALAFANIFGILNDMGLRYVYVREVSRDIKRAEPYLSNVLLIQLGLSALALVIIFLAINILESSHQTRMVVYLMAGAEVLRSAKYLYRFLFRAMDQFEYEALTVLFERILLLAAGIGVLFMGFDVVVFALVFLITRAVDLTLTVVIAVRKTFRPSLKVDFSLWPDLLRNALPFALSGIVMLLFAQISTVLISFLRNDAEVGWYSAAYKLIEGVVLVPAIFSSSLYPSLSRLHRDRAAVVDLFSRGIKYILLASVPITILGYVLAEPIILLIFGVGYVNSIPVLRIALLSISFVYLHYLGGTVLAAVDRQKQSFLIACLVLVVNIVLNVFFIFRFGYSGAAVAIMLSEILFGLLVAGYLAFLGYRVPYLKIVLKPLLAASMVALLVSILNITVIPALILSVPLYLGLLTLLSFWDEDEIQLFKRMSGHFSQWVVLSFHKITSH